MASSRGGPALVVEVPVPASPFAGWFARLVDDGFGVALGGAGGAGAFSQAPGVSLMR